MPAPGCPTSRCSSAAAHPSRPRWSAGRRLFRQRRRQPGVWLDGSAGDHRGLIDATIDHAAETDGRPGIAEIRMVEGEIRAAGRRCWSATSIPKTRTRRSTTKAYYRTGDHGRWVDDDYLVVTGRTKDIIIRNGENISPKEVEDMLAGHPGIAEVAVVGVPDPRTGERACAVIVDIRSACARSDRPARTAPQRRGLAKFKIPEQIVIWDALPKNDAGKILKHQIRATLTKVE